MKLENKTHTQNQRERDVHKRKEGDSDEKKGKMKSEYIVKEIKSGLRKKYNEIENSKIESKR